MKTFNNPRLRIPMFALTTVWLLLSSLDTWTHAAAPANSSADFPTASEGELDPAFGTGGKLTTDFFNHIDLATDMALQPDGRIIVVGHTIVGSDLNNIERSDFALIRYNNDGSLDDSFG